MPDQAQNWTTKSHHAIPRDGVEHVVPLRVRAEDHPGALVVALNAVMAVRAYQHLEELPTLAADDLYYLLVDVGKVHASTGALVDELIYQLRQAGASWETIGLALDVHRSSARERYQRIVEARGRGLRTPEDQALAEQSARGLIDRLADSIDEARQHPEQRSPRPPRRAPVEGPCARHRGGLNRPYQTCTCETRPE